MAAETFKMPKTLIINTEIVERHAVSLEAGLLMKSSEHVACFFEDVFIQKMRQSDSLFDCLYVESYFRGSLREVKRQQASQFDLNIVFEPKKVCSELQYRETKGFIRISKKDGTETNKLGTFCSKKGNLFPEFICDWLKDVCTKANELVSSVDLNKHSISKVTICSLEPAMTILTQHDEFHVNLVPVILRGITDGHNVHYVPKHLQNNSHFANLWKVSYADIERQMLSKGW